MTDVVRAHQNLNKWNVGALSAHAELLYFHAIRRGLPVEGNVAEALRGGKNRRRCRCMGLVVAWCAGAYWDHIDPDAVATFPDFNHEVLQVPLNYNLGFPVGETLLSKYGS